MKIIEDSYQVQLNLKMYRKQKFLSFADIHYGVLEQLFYKKKMKQFFHHIVTNFKNVDAILIPGDLLFYLIRFENTFYLKSLIEDLEELSFLLSAPIFISYGNHDLLLEEDKYTEQEKRKRSLGYYLDNRRNGIYVLDNEQISFSDFCITGFSPKRDAYHPNNMTREGLLLVRDCFSNCNFQFSKGKVNILLSHDNRFFASPFITNEYGDLYDKLNLIIGGHLHDGYIPYWFQKLFSKSLKDYGIYERFHKIAMCRGAFVISRESIGNVILPETGVEKNIYLNNHEALSIVNRGVAKYSWVIPSILSYSKIEVSNQNQGEKIYKKSKI